MAGSSIITDTLKRDLAQHLYNELEGTRIGDSDNHYVIAIGRPNVWNPINGLDTVTDPNNTEREQRLFRYGMQSVMAVSAYSFATSYTNWSAGTIYYQYNDNTSGTAPYYFIRTDENNVYICMRNGKNSVGVVQPSLNKPTHVNSTLQQGADGYIWKYMYTISNNDVDKLLSANFLPVRFVDSDYAVAYPTYAAQYAISQAAIMGQIVGYRVDAAGSGYTSAPTITVNGNGTGATAHAVLNSTGGVAAVEVGDSAGVRNTSSLYVAALGQNYDYANVSVSSGSAKIIPIFGPKLGLGYNPVNDLRATTIIFNIKPYDEILDDSGELAWTVGTSYRQVSLIRNLLDINGDKFNGSASRAAKKLTFSNVVGASLVYGNTPVMEGDSSGAKAFVDWYDDSSTVWYHQDEYTGFTDFALGESITIEDADAPGTIVSFDSDKVDVWSGNMYFISNLEEVNRDAASTDDIKLVVKL